MRLFFECIRTNHLLNKLRSFCSNKLLFLSLTAQSTIMEISNFSENSSLLNHLLRIFKCYVYKVSEDDNLSIQTLKVNIFKTKNIEIGISNHNAKITLKHNRKWSLINHISD